MKKRLLLIGLLIFMGLFLVLIVIDNNRQIKLNINEEEEILFELNTGSFELLSITPWYHEEENRYYVFLPSFCTDNRIYIDDISDNLVYYNGEMLEQGDKFFYQAEEDYVIEILDKDGDTKEYEFCILKSENISSIFINTQSGNMEYLHQNKENEESGHIDIVQNTGKVEYHGALESVTGRGNASWWQYNKKSYSFTLNKDYPICGMESGKKWNLHTIFLEGTKMATKIALDMAAYMEMDASMNATWVDLYLNGEYAGVYLLSEAITIDDNRVDIYDLEKENRQNNKEIDNSFIFSEERIKGYELENVDTLSGGYLIEKDKENYFSSDKETAGFITESGYTFSIKAPKHASREQVEYISDYIQNVEDLIEAGDERCWDYIDIDSFVKRFLIDEISLDVDANITSMYFYKDKDSDILYAGPAWDYNIAFGECNGGWAEGIGVWYEGSVNNPYRTDRLEWVTLLYEQPVFQDKVKEHFIEVLPYMEWLLEEGIDQYERRIEASLNMETVRWSQECPEGEKVWNFQDYKNNIRYLKFFIANRLNCLIDRWDIPHEKFEFTGNGTMHTVTYVQEENVISTQMIMDGEVIEELPYLDEEIYHGWYYTYSTQKSRPYIPVLEDCTLFARKK